MRSVEQQPQVVPGTADPAPISASTDHSGAAAMMDRDLASASAGVRVTAIGDGTADATMTVRDDMANGHGITHGGFVFLLADTAFACACNDSRGAPWLPAPTSPSWPRPGRGTYSSPGRPGAPNAVDQASTT